MLSPVLVRGEFELFTHCRKFNFCCYPCASDLPTAGCHIYNHC